MHARTFSRWLLGCLVLAAAWWTLDLAVLRAGVPHPLDDNWEDNLIARRLLAGDAFRSDLVYPPLWGLRDPETQTVPVLIHSPVLPLLSLPWLVAFGPRSLDHVAWAAALVAVLVLIPTFRVTARVFDEPIAAAASALFTLAPITLEAVHHSLSVVLGAFLLVLALDQVVRVRPRPLVAGLVLGVGYLVRPEMALAAPVVLALAMRSSPYARAAALRFVTGFVACAAAWWWHHWTGTGIPFFSLSSYTLIGFWGRYPDTAVLRDFDLTPARWSAVYAAELPQLWRKWAVFFPHTVKHALESPTGATGWLAPIGLFAAWRGWTRDDLHSGDAGRVRASDFALAALALALVPVVTGTIALYQRLYVVPFLPLHAIGAAVGVRALAQLMPRWAHRPRAWLGMLTLLVLPSAGPALRDGAREARQLERRIETERAALEPERARGPRDRRLMFSDSPDFVAWTTGRPTLWVAREEFERLYGAGGREAARLGLPPRAEVGTWFHDDSRDPTEIGHALRR